MDEIFLRVCIKKNPNVFYIANVMYSYNEMFDVTFYIIPIL